MQAKITAVLLIWTVLCGCASSSIRAPVGRYQDAKSPPPPFHMVRRGDSLHAIAWRYGLDYRRLAQWNGLRPPYTIYVGQRLKTRPAPRVAAPTPPRASSNPSPAAAQNRAPKATATRKPQPARTAPEIKAWRWPVRGEIISSFDESGQTGLDIAGRRGQPVAAAAAGRVVYSGGGLIGYGKLIIVKHNDNFLSAYAHNNKLLTKEGDFVDSGQRIADMGSTGTDRVMLHFEIRRDGRPVDPRRYLPK